MRIVFKVEDGSPLARFIQQRADELGVKPTTYLRALALREMRANAEKYSIVPTPAAASQPPQNDADDDDAVLAGLLGDM